MLRSTISTILSFALLLAGLASASAGEPPPLGLDASLFSAHFPAALNGERRFNDVNPGVGIERQFTPEITFMGGVYRNSYRRGSLYLAAALTPCPWAWHIAPGEWSARPGIVLGLVSGYSRDENPVAPFFAAALLQIRNAGGEGLNVIALPRIDGQAGFVGLQLVTPLP